MAVEMRGPWEGSREGGEVENDALDVVVVVVAILLMMWAATVAVGRW